jgi:ribosomal protein S18 acetylase RimI-like enzyme
MTSRVVETSPYVIAKGSSRAVDRHAVGRLVYGAYAEVARALGMREEDAVDVLGKALDLEQCYLAWKGDSVVGFQGLVERHARPFHFRFRLIRERCTFLRSLVYFLLLNSRSWRILRPGEMMFENLVVSPEARKEGIGARLVERAENYARENGYSTVSIEVVDTNRLALGMFERKSYIIIRSRHTGLLTRRAGFTGNHFMRKRIAVP